MDWRPGPLSCLSYFAADAWEASAEQSELVNFTTRRRNVDNLRSTQRRLPDPDVASFPFPHQHLFTLVKQSLLERILGNVLLDDDVPLKIPGAAVSVCEHGVDWELAVLPRKLEVNSNHARRSCPPVLASASLCYTISPSSRSVAYTAGLFCVRRDMTFTRLALQKPVMPQA